MSYEADRPLLHPKPETVGYVLLELRGLGFGTEHES